MSDFCALSVALCAEAGHFVVSTWGVLDVARDESFGRFLGGIFVVCVGRGRLTDLIVLFANKRNILKCSFGLECPMLQCFSS